MRASAASGGRSLSQYSQLGRSCNAIAQPIGAVAWRSQALSSLSRIGSISRLTRAW
jgi:hypothetical protein